MTIDWTFYLLHLSFIQIHILVGCWREVFERFLAIFRVKGQDITGAHCMHWIVGILSAQRMHNKHPLTLWLKYSVLGGILGTLDFGTVRHRDLMMLWPTDSAGWGLTLRNTHSFSRDDRVSVCACIRVISRAGYSSGAVCTAILIPYILIQTNAATFPHESFANFEQGNWSLTFFMLK